MTGQASSIPLSADELADQLEADVLSRAPGTRLPSERQLATAFGLSRPVVREALRGLQERGLITALAGRGSFVNEVAPTRGRAPVDAILRRGDATLRDLVGARRLLETESAGLAAERRSAEDLTRMRALLVALDDTDDLERQAKLDLAFHEAIAIASGNTVLMIMFGSISELVYGMILRSLTDRNTQRAGLPLHLDILDAIAQGKPKAARQRMDRHLGLALEHYGADLDEPLTMVLRRRARNQPGAFDLLDRTSNAIANLAQASAPTGDQDER